MLRISVDLLHGVIRATSADDTTLTGAGGSPEWPPSPARLYAALVAGGGTQERCPADVGINGLSLLESPPLIFASGHDDVSMSPLADRYVVIDRNEDGTVQEYPARKSQRISPGVRIAPRCSQIVYVWPDVSPRPDELDALRYRAARVPYLGCSDSPAQVRVDATEELPTLPQWRPDSKGRHRLPVATPGYLEVLDEHFLRWSSGEPLRRSWMPSSVVAYTAPGERSADPPVTPQAVWMRFDRPVAVSRLLMVTRLLRAAVLEKAEAIVGDRNAVPPVVHGHLSGRGSEHHSARWLALPTVGVPFADGRIRGACVWLPPGVDPLTFELVTTAVTHVGELVLPGVFRVAVRPFDGTNRPITSHPRFWSAPARRWVSATAVLPDRFSKRAPDHEAVVDWCHHAGLPTPVVSRVAEVPLVTGAAKVRVGDIDQRLRGRQFYLEVEFAEPVHGPMVIGKGRGFGIGLMMPADRRRDE